MTTLSERPPALWKRLIYGGGVLAAMVAAIVFAGFMAGGKGGNPVAERIEAELDAHDPGWRLADLDATRPTVPDAENSALVVLEVARVIEMVLPPGGPEDPLDPDELIEAQPPPHRQPAERVRRLLAEQVAKAPVLPQARKLADLPRGRYPHSADDLHPMHGLGMDIGPRPDGDPARNVADLLTTDALALSQQKKIADALRSCRAAINAGRSLADEPGMPAQLARMGCFSRAARMVEYCLSQGPGDDAELRALGKVVAEEEKDRWLERHLRHERARVHQLMAGLVAGTVPVDPSDLAAMEDEWLFASEGAVRRRVRQEHPVLIGLFNRAIVIASLPPHEQHEQELLLLRHVDSLPEMTSTASNHSPISGGQGDAYRRSLARQRALLVMMTVERYRLAKKAWPATLDELVPAYLDRVPADPFDGKPLRYVDKEGVRVVYSVGPDGNDDGGAVDRAGLENIERLMLGTDIGYRLWDADRRGQPSRPQPPPEKEP